MKEEYVSLEQARLLKECGFDWKCAHYYTPENTTNGYQWFTSGEEQNYNEHHLTLTTSAPTQALAQKWLRDEKGIEVVVRPVFRSNSRRGYDWSVYDDCSGYCALRASPPFSENYESALSAGLDAALELIEER